MIFAACEIGATEWNESGYYTGGTAEDWEELEAVAPEAVTAWKEAGQPLNRNACARIYGEELTKEAQDAHTVASHRAKYCEEWRDELREIWAIYQAITATDRTTDSTTAQPGAGATLYEADETTATAPAPTEDRPTLLRYVAAGLRQSGRSKNPLDALRARLYALYVLGVGVYDLMTLAASIPPESVGGRSATSCALEAIQRLSSTADRRAAEVLTPDEWQTLFGTSHPKQHAAA